MVLHTIRYKLKAYGNLMRTKVCLITVFAIIIGALISGAFFNIFTIIPFILALIAGFLITGFGNVINDYYDYNIDSSSPILEIKERPLLSGKVKLREALIFSGILVSVSIILGYFVSSAFFYLVLFNIFVSFIYARLLKPIVLLKNVGVAWLGASSFLGGSLIFSPVIGLSVAILSVVAFLTTMSWEALKDIRDLQNDVANRVKTIPYYVGEKRTRVFSYILLALAFIVLIATYQSFSLSYLVGVIPAILVSVYSVKLPVRKAYKMIRISTWLVILGLLLSAFV